MPWKPFTRGRRTKPEAVSDSETEWNRRETSRKPNQDTTRGGDWSPAPRGPAGAVEHTSRSALGSEHNGAAELGTPEKRQYKLNQGELDCADAELCRRAGKPPPFSGHVPLRGPPRRGWLYRTAPWPEVNSTSQGDWSARRVRVGETPRSQASSGHHNTARTATAGEQARS